MRSLLRRRKPSGETAPGTAPGVAVKGQDRPVGKGRPTPKRQRSAPPAPPPKTRREAYSRIREKSREERVEARAGMRQGEDRYSLERDRGPIRRLVRDIVDARRNAGSYFFGSALVIIVLTSIPSLPRKVAVAVSFLWLALIAVLAFDSMLIGRIVRAAIHERFPDEPGSLRWHVIYGIMRAATFRRLRNPKPQVKLGQSV